MAVGQRLRSGVWCLAVVLGACSPLSTEPTSHHPLPPTGPDGAETALPSSAPWTIGAPETQGFDPLALADSLARIADDTPGIHAVVLARHGTVVADIPFFPYDGATPHGIGAITRIVTIASLGVAVDRGLLGLDDRVVSFFPERTIANRDARKDRITVRDLAAMTSGLDCSEAGEAGTALDLPMIDEPGAMFRPCGPATHLLSAVLERATGVPLDEFARQFLFEPLGISKVHWSTDPSGLAWGSGGLALRPLDLAKLGQLWAAGGRWEGRTVIDPAWVAAMTTPDAPAAAGGDAYGLGWWIPRDPAHGTFRAIGAGGQLLMVDADLGLVAVVLGSGIVPETVVERLMPALISDAAPLVPDELGGRRLAVVRDLVAAAPDAVGATGPASTIRRIDGVTWSVEPNPYGLERLRVDIDGRRPAATLTMRFADLPLDQALPLGLDGVPRVGRDRHRRPVASRGWWSDSRTLVLELDEVVEGQAITLELRFAKRGDAVTITGRFRGQDDSFTTEAAQSG